MVIKRMWETSVFFNVHCCEKFHLSWPNGCANIVFNYFQNKGCLSTWIFTNLNFLRVWRAISVTMQIYISQPNGCEDITIFRFSRWRKFLSFE